MECLPTMLLVRNHLTFTQNCGCDRLTNFLVALAVVNKQGNINTPVEAPAEAGHLPIAAPVTEDESDHWTELIFVGIASVVIGFLIGFVPIFITYQKLKNKNSFEPLY